MVDEAPSPFCKSLPTLQYAWDSVSLSLLKTCPRKYQLTMLEGWTAPHMPPSLAFGILIHLGLERYDVERAKGASVDDALVSALRLALTKAKEMLISGDNTRTPFTLARSIVWYTEHYKDEGLSTVVLANGKPALELSFRIALPMQTPDGTNYLLCGHMDKVVVYGGPENGNMKFTLDRKHSGYPLDDKYFGKYTPDNQMSLYSASGDIVLDQPTQGVIVDAIQVGVNFTRFARGFAARSEEQKQEWMQDLMHWLGMAETYAKQNYWPMNDTACHHYSGCGFRGICGKSPSVRPIWLQSFAKRNWNPLENRGE